MKLSVLLKTTEFRGDHAGEITLLYDVLPDETVQQLVKRVDLRNSDDLIIKLVKEGV